MGVGEVVGVGVGMSVRYAKSDVSNLWAASSSIGAFYSPSFEISYGIMLGGLGTGILFASNRSVTKLSSEKLPRNLQAGVTLRFPSSPDETIFILSVANEKIFGEKGIRYKGGVEVLPIKFFTARIGYMAMEHLAVAHFGFGVQWDRYGFDYSISPGRASDLSTAVSLRIKF